MTNALDHDRCSELLRGFVLGTLERDVSVAVEAHLQGCPRCRAELTSLRSLLAPAERMSPGERAELRAGVARAIDADAQASREPARRWYRYQLVAAAAVIVLGVATVATLMPRLWDAGTSDMGARPQSIDGEDAGGGRERGPVADRPAAPEPQPEGVTGGAGDDGDAAGTSETEGERVGARKDKDDRRSNEQDPSSLAGRAPPAGIGARIGIVATR